MADTRRVTVEDEQGLEHTLPTRFEVCDRCEGHGTHTNPSIDGNGISADEWNGPDWDDESRHMYLSGGYDVRCEECHGERVVSVVDEERCEPALLALWHAKLEDDAAYAREVQAERRMGY